MYWKTQIFHVTFYWDILKLNPQHPRAHLRWGLQLNQQPQVGLSSCIQGAACHLQAPKGRDFTHPTTIKVQCPAQGLIQKAQGWLRDKWEGKKRRPTLESSHLFTYLGQITSQEDRFSRSPQRLQFSMFAPPSIPQTCPVVKNYNKKYCSGYSGTHL